MRRCPRLNEGTAAARINVEAGQLRSADRAGVPIRIGDIDPLERVFVASLGGDQTCVTPAGDLRRLQAATCLERSESALGVVRNEAIKAGRVAQIFGQINIPGSRIDRCCFVRKAAHADDRIAGGLRRVRSDLEHVAMALAVRGRFIAQRFLAR